MAVGTVSTIEQDNWQLIASGSPTASSSSYSFSSISGYKTLMIAFKKVVTSADTGLYARFNGDSTDRNYNSMVNGYSVTGDYKTDGMSLTGYPQGATTGVTGYAVINYANSTTMFKTMQEGASYVSNKYAGIWANNVDPISSIVIYTTGGTFTGSGTFYLYGIAA
jgi:hypothetical protein